jgi:hypothetical protein
MRKTNTKSQLKSNKFNQGRKKSEEKKYQRKELKFRKKELRTLDTVSLEQTDVEPMAVAMYSLANMRQGKNTAYHSLVFGLAMTAAVTDAVEAHEAGPALHKLG